VREWTEEGNEDWEKREKDFDKNRYKGGKGINVGREQRN
jgi:hypothetical protein